jgi:hypothetical protein
VASEKERCWIFERALQLRCTDNDFRSASFQKVDKFRLSTS